MLALNFGIVLLVISAYLLIRNHIVYCIQIYFIDNRYDQYHELPHYHDMMLSLKYQHMWTVNSWSRWINNKSQ